MQSPFAKGDCLDHHLGNLPSRGSMALRPDFEEANRLPEPSEIKNVDRNDIK
jgi:hypothetical protein